MSNKASDFAMNLAVTTNIISLTQDVIGRVSDHHKDEVSAVLKKAMLERAARRLAYKLREAQVVA